jgi:DNA-directed RNA polymerase specialized sigma subunit
MTNEEFEKIYYPKYAKLIRALARKRAKRDEALYEDLEQVGRIALWNLDPSKAKTNEDAWIRQAIKFKMIDHLRKQRYKDLDSLDFCLNQGDQVSQDEFGETQLVRRPKWSRKHLVDDAPFTGASLESVSWDDDAEDE